MAKMTKDTFYKQHIECANSNGWKVRENTNILACPKLEGPCTMHRCITIHKHNKRDIKVV
jgi:hypothetical protein